MSRNADPAAGIGANALILSVAAFLVGFANLSFFAGVLKVYPLTPGNALALLSLVPVFGGAIVIGFAVLCFRHTTKPVLIAALLVAALCAHFMDSYGVVINDEMLQNVAQSGPAEARELLNVKLLVYLVLLGIVPALLVGRTPLRWRGFGREVVARSLLVGATLVVMAGSLLSFGDFYASFVREHKELRARANPTYALYSAIKYANAHLGARAAQPLVAVGTDARVPTWDKHRELIILVVGETARADRFSLNGYARDTNPSLRRAGAISFTNFWACGTSTAVSVPCMFSVDAGSGGRAEVKENLLDVLKHAGVNVLWLDNNSDSKGVALRVPYQDFRSPDVNPLCDLECRDEGMLSGLQSYIDAHPRGDIFIVLHQMGNHGPAYYRRYPQEFEHFKPACRSADLSQCSREEIDNAYDNAIRYTDHFLGRVIALLKGYDDRFETAMFYVSDHGESLGEGGVYLHGLPKAIAPQAQLHVPAVMWFGTSYDDVDRPALAARRDARFTHANVFHTVLGFMEIESSVYRADLDILQAGRTPFAEARSTGPETRR